MQIALDPDEAWSAMSLIVSQVLDGVEMSAEGREAVKKWRSDYQRWTKIILLTPDCSSDAHEATSMNWEPSSKAIMPTNLGP